MEIYITDKFTIEFVSFLWPTAALPYKKVLSLRQRLNVKHTGYIIQ